ncbi:uncharacterized protein BYT42DRAFT_563762 [Radiomyces spectabilis]|uniref:uncharacterized protein n=1 Tax=Radiomyces spectabilis TaxID=64574 RepID=UPI00221F645C|nr:uncharacterized protein BYT42DRAFT_563762 [Radiomyces spectabilis]KAI8384827.1 hypothetical protein BYT42DRAFT_563762 [Radiomyces spectabilis]
MPPKTAKTQQPPMTQAQEEEMSSALIAQLLAEDAMGSGHGDYYAEYSNDANGYDMYHMKEDNDGSYEEDSEDDFSPKRGAAGRGRGRGRPKKSDTVRAAPGKRGRKRKTPEEQATNPQPVPTTETTESNDMTTENTLTAAVTPTDSKPTSKKPRKPVPEGFNTGVYTAEEEERFLTGLDMYGRDWGKLAAHIATRDPNSIRSHAQKHFIKLFRDNVPLPDKVRESGAGYTLSGKPLDPNSAAAKPYLIRLGYNPAATTTSDNKVAKTEPAVPTQDTITNDLKIGTEQPNSVDANPAPSTDPSTTDALTAVPVKTDPVTSIGAVSPAVNEKTKEKSRSTTPEKSESPLPRPLTSQASSYDENGRTNYSKSRLRRPRDRASIAYNQINKDDDPLTMVKCEPFMGKPGSNVSGSQPFEMEVHSNALLAMDFHAHLMTTEIIGFLAGEWDRTQRKMYIKEAFPCRSLNTGQNDVNVEMDPNSALETRQLIEDKNMTVVGWYHSHPTFIPDPSLVDIQNQKNYQMLCREECSHMDHHRIEPFVGAIVGPYDPRLPGSASVINWFYVGNTWEDRAIPKRLIYELIDDDHVPEPVADRLFQLLDVYKHSPEKVDFADFWRQDASESKLKKLIKSLASRMPWIQKKLTLVQSSSTEDEQQEQQPQQQQDQQEQEPSQPVTDAFLEQVQKKLTGW